VLTEKKIRLIDIFQSHKGLVTEKFPHHLEIYEWFFDKFRGKNIGIFEIGIREGGSLQLWRKYFGPEARIYGLDIQDKAALTEKTDSAIFVGDQSNTIFMQDLAQKIKPVHIVIDDGSHKVNDQRLSFECIFPVLENGGIYIIEDIHTSYREEYGGGYKNYRSFVEYLKTMIDGIHSSEFPGVIPVIFNEIFAVHFYPSLAVIEKRGPWTWGGPTMRPA